MVDETGTAPAGSSLAHDLANQLAAILREDGHAAGDPLTERALAARLRVSRSPIRAALGLLEERGLVVEKQGGGYAVANGGKSLSHRNRQTPEDALYFRLVEDRLREALPERVTENELLRRYPMSRAQLAQLLWRAAGEGWMERLPGYGWAFLPVVTSLDSYRESYRFRLAIEPAAILEPGFVLNVAALESRRREQQQLIAGGLRSDSDARIFELNSGLHETIIACGNNRFFADGLKRINQLRRLMEYRQKLDREAAVARCREHIALIDLLLAGKLAQAAAKMKRHLSEVGVAKSRMMPGV